MFQGSTMGDLGPYTWNGNPFDYINSILGLSYGSPNYDPNAEANAQALLDGFPNLNPPPPKPSAASIAAAAAAKAAKDAADKAASDAAWKEWTDWFEKNKVPLMFGGALVVILLTKKK